MRIIRFSLQRLLILTALVAVLLYALLLRPVAIAKRFTRQLETPTGLESVIAQYFGKKIPMDRVSVESECQKRTWTDIYRCRQRFSIGLKKPKPNTNGKTVLALCRDFYATPIGVQVMPRATVIELPPRPSPGPAPRISA